MEPWQPSAPAPPGHRAQRSRWWQPSGWPRRASLAIWSTALVLALAGYLLLEVQENRALGVASPFGGTRIEVQHGATGRLGGSDWRLVSATRSSGSGQFTYVNMIIAITPQTSQASAHQLSLCQFDATDAAGRVWQPASNIQGPDNMSTNVCGSQNTASGNIPTGQMGQVFVAFLVPANAAATLRLEIRDSVPPAKSYLLLDR